VAEVHLIRATYLHVRKRTDEAKKHYEEAADLLVPLVKRFPSVPDQRQLLVSALNNLGQLLRDAKRPREAVAVWQRLISECNGLVQMFPGTLDYQAKLGRGYNELGIALGMSNKVRPAEAAWREALAVQEKLVSRQATEPIYWRDLLESQENLTQFLRAVSPSKEAEQACRQWVDTQQRRLAQFPRRAEMAEQWAGAGLVLADVLKERKKPGEAAEFLLQNLTQLGKTPGLVERRRKQWQKVYADRALPLLAQAVKAGMIERQRLRTDSLFDSLRNRAAFQQLLGED
jgi:tetratricopeptide (TPR) repeat protein